LILTAIVVLALFFLPILYSGELSVWAANNDILVYYTDTPFYTPEIFTADLNTLGFNVTIKYRANSDELGITSASPINLMNYGQVWIIDVCLGEDFTANEISAIKTFRDNGGGLLLSVDDRHCQRRVNQIAKEFNNNTNIFYGNYITGGYCVSVSTTWPGHPTVHPLYKNGLTHLSSSNSDAKLNIENSNIKVTVKHSNNAYGAVLDEPGKGRVVFDTSYFRFTILPLGRCSTSSRSQYQQNIAQYLGETAECGNGSCDFPEDSSTCPADCGCNHNARCEPERGENFWNCPDDCKALAESPCLCRADPKHLGGAGFVPCGRKADDLDTSNCECCPCTLCHAFLVFKRITDFLIKDLFFPLLVLAIIIAGILHVFGAIRITDITKAKAVLTAGAIGTMVIFTSWMTINFFLYFMIHEKTNEGIATIFSEPWSEISCNYPTEPCATAYCGDGIVQKPNSERVNEECERGEKWEAFKARAQAGEAIDVDSNGVIDEHDYFASICSCDEDCYLTADVSSCCGNGRWEAGEECDPTVSETDWRASGYAKDYDGDGAITSVDYNIMKSTCRDDCRIACPFVSVDDIKKINMGCYGDDSPQHPTKGLTNPCQKGEWVCDDKGNDDPSDDEVVCANVYNDPDRPEYIGQDIFDYCCDDYNPNTAPTPSATIKAKVIRVSSGAGKRCDEVCRTIGGICIGIGQYADMNCKMVTCHTGTNICDDVGSSPPACNLWGGGGHADTVPAIGMCRDTMGTSGASCRDGSQATKDGDPTNDPSCAYEIFVGGSVCYCYVPFL